MDRPGDEGQSVTGRQSMLTPVSIFFPVKTFLHKNGNWSQQQNNHSALTCMASFAQAAIGRSRCCVLVGQPDCQLGLLLFVGSLAKAALHSL